MKRIVLFVLFFSISAFAQNKCPEGYGLASDAQKIDKLDESYLLIVKDKIQVSDESEADGIYRAIKIGAVNYNFRLSLKWDRKKIAPIDPATELKILNSEQLSPACGPLSKCLPVHHEDLSYIEINLKEAASVKDLRTSGVQVCKASVALPKLKANVVDSGRENFVDKSEVSKHPSPVKSGSGKQ